MISKNKTLYEEASNSNVTRIIAEIRTAVNNVRRTCDIKYAFSSAFMNQLIQIIHEMEEWEEVELKEKRKRCYLYRFPERQPDGDVLRCPGNKCYYTGKTFGLIINRRHHCRTCNRVYCGKCSTEKHVGDRESRVCYKCIEFEGEEKAEKLAFTPDENPMGHFEIED